MRETLSFTDEGCSNSGLDIFLTTEGEQQWKRL